jgi:hypothetical protein
VVSRDVERRTGWESVGGKAKCEEDGFFISPMPSDYSMKNFAGTLSAESGLITMKRIVITAISFAHPVGHHRAENRVIYAIWSR